MKKTALLTAICLMLSVCSACASRPDETTAATLPTVTVPVTQAPTERPAPSVPDEPKVIDYALHLPDGFSVSESREDRTMFLSPGAPGDASFIRVDVLPRNAQALNRSEQDLKALILAAAEDAMAAQPTEETDASSESTDASSEAAGQQLLQILALQKVQLDGWPALFCEYDFLCGAHSAHVIRLEAEVNDANYVFTFCDTTDRNRWLDAFDLACDSVDFLLDTESIAFDYSGLTRYELPCGLAIRAEDGMAPVRVPGFTDGIGNRSVVLLVTIFDKAENDLLDMTRKEYADLLARTNDLDPFQTSLYGDLFTTFSSTDDSGARYENDLFVMDLDQSYLTLQFTCSAEDQAAYADAFPLWASSLTPIP